MLKYENGSFVRIYTSDILPSYEDSVTLWAEAVKEAGFEYWARHGSEDRLNFTIYRRGYEGAEEGDWLVDVDGGEVGIYVPVYCPTEVDFMAWFALMGAAVCASEIVYITGTLKETVISIEAIKGKGKHWSLADMLIEILTPLIYRGER